MALPYSPARPFRLGTRASPLARAQTDLVVTALCAAHGWTREHVEIVAVTASGDRVLDRPLADIGGKALWTKELDQWLGSGETDASVHSMKDVETFRPPGLKIAAMLAREDVRDVLIGADRLEAIRPGGTMGTSSPRRSAQVRRARPDVEIVLFRGNVATRLRKQGDGDADATLLAAAGLARLGMADVGAPVPVEVMLPAPAQGAIGIETRAHDEFAQAALNAIRCADTFDCVMTERAVLRALGGTCHSPIAALAQIDGDAILLRAEILSPDGRECHEEVRTIARGDEASAFALGEKLLARASPGLRALFNA